MSRLNMQLVDDAFYDAAREGSVLDGLYAATAEVGRQLAGELRDMHPGIHTSHESVAQYLEYRTGYRAGARHG